ncbi:unnamed protein product, partial [Trichobilharzia regenti]
MRVLILLKKRILVAAHTHSAVDNLLLRLCQVVVGCTALSASGGNDSRHAALVHEKFDVVLIDEASQLMCPTSLGPLLCLNNAQQQSDDSVKCCRFVLVGDPYQLPPLVRSQKAKQGGLNQSLFSLLLNHNHHHHHKHDYGQSVVRNPSDDELSKKEYIIELTIQYRMNSSILALSNRLVYQNKMSCADSNVSQATL